MKFGAGDEETCSICYEDLSCTRSILPCGHHFCNKCICEWFKNNKTCPICKREYTYPEIINICPDLPPQPPCRVARRLIFEFGKNNNVKQLNSDIKYFKKK